jgi:UDP-N-acetylmuramate--alanine ligase
VIFQPHRFTRLRDLFEEFLTAFDDADVLYLMEVYPAGEDPIGEISSRRLYEALRARGHLDVRYLGGESDPARTIVEDSIDGDIIATLGAGDVYRVGEACLALLGEDREFDERA